LEIIQRIRENELLCRNNYFRSRKNNGKSWID